ncbi:MAG: hypothetical protein JST82_14005 [Bacteroidetes bacterium]|nr:hypothetical protein [Bacteroidota bacterium]
MKGPHSSDSQEKRSFSIIERFRKAKSLAITVAISLTYQLVFPTASWALTAGPSSPDFSSFEPVSTTNMVNEFTGQFVYNIPVLEIPGASGGGYALSLSYHSGDGPETEASWVGAGWTLNPGCINRTKRGLPDDYKGDTVTYYNQMPKNWTIAATGFGTAQIYSGLLSVGGQTTIRYNNYKGFGFIQGFGLHALSGLFSLGYDISAGDGTFNFSVNPAALLSLASNMAKRSPSFAGSTAGRQILKLTESGTGGAMMSSVYGFAGSATSTYISYLLTDMASPYNLTPYTGSSTSGTADVTFNPGPVQVGITTGLNVSYTTQQNIPQRDVPAYGFMYSGNAPSNDGDTAEQAVMDYTIENESSFNERDKYLPVPTNTPDAYFISGEGLGGGFRMYNDHIGIYSPNYVRSVTSMDMFGFDGHMGLTFGAGGEALAEGEHVLRVRSSWIEGSNGSSNDYKAVAPDFNDADHAVFEGNFFRFNNDLGGKVIYDEGDGAIAPDVLYDNIGLPAAMQIQKDASVPAGRRSARASYIGYHTNAERKKKVGSNRALTYEHNEKIHNLSGTDNSANNSLDNIIGEISVYNEEGNNYVYGLPVYATDEKNMMQGFTASNPGNYYSLANINNDKKVGEEFTKPYVTSYLLTQITTPDYVDVNLNGPDDTDFGGYTRFSYTRIHGAQQKTGAAKSSMYKWRAPYKGVYHNLMRLSDNKDDMATYQSGYKEIYVLDTIMTKTHYAVFTTANRMDSWSARVDDVDAAAGLGYDEPNDKCMKYLKEITLYAKATDSGQNDKIVKKVHFQYDYSSWPHLFNNFTDTGANTGKLTLKRVWFEYNGVVNAAISPYEFDYSYPTVTYPSKYSNIYDEMNDGLMDQTPSYTPFIDCWGNYQYNMENRRNKLQSWPSQKPGTSFDPAAWQLKRIVLPSGGEIHIQYEQNTYAKVQNRSACAMVSLTPLSADYSNSTKFYLNLDDLDIDKSSSTEKQRLVDRIRSEFSDGGLMMYYKFFYSLQGSDTESVISCNGDYIDGFANVVNEGIESSGPNAGKVFVEFEQNTPYKMCYDYLKKELGGRILEGDCSLPNNTLADPSQAGSFFDAIKSTAKMLDKAAKTELAAKVFDCKALNPKFSYLRIPIWNKKGGGVRVKRLMMYNKGIESGTEAVYGTEYVYDDIADGTSYGVATNEPYENKEENPIVDYLDKRLPWDSLSKKQQRKRKFQGRDVDQFRGPYSMNVLPAASIGYSKIIKKNIHQDAVTGSGYTEIEYYTVNDYPYFADSKHPASYSVSDIQGAEPGGPYVDIGLFSYTIGVKSSVSQGYTFIQNQMHGQLKSIADYPGEYTLTNVSNPASHSPIASTKYYYYNPGEPIRMFDFSSFSSYYDYPGKEEDITIDRRAVDDVSYQTRLTSDFTVGYFPPYVFVPYPVAFPITSTSSKILNTIVTSKVVHYPAILKRTEVMKDGVYRVTDNIAFDPLTGKPVVTSTYDGYDGQQLYGDIGAGLGHRGHVGVITQYDVPASSQYSSMGQKAWNEKYCYYGSLSVSSSGGNYSVSGVDNADMFHEGDLVAIHSGSGVAMANVLNVSASTIDIGAAYRYNHTITTGSYSKMEVIKSGYTNQLHASMGGMTEYGTDYIDAAFTDPRTKLLKALDDSLKRLIYHPRTLPDTAIVIPEHNSKNVLVWSDAGWECDTAPHTLKVGSIRLMRYATDNYYFQIFDTTGQPMDYHLDHSGCHQYLYGIWTPATLSFSCPTNPFPGGVNVYSLGTSFNPPDGFDYYNYTGVVLLTFRNTATSEQITWPVRWCTCCQIPGGVIHASTTKYKDSWTYPTSYVINPSFNDYEAGKKGKWRPYETYVFNDTTIPGSNPDVDQRNYKSAGVSNRFIKGPWRAIDFYYPALWTKTNTVTTYSPDGFALEDKNGNDVYSTVKYGYRGMLPIVSAKNASYNSTRFESFENHYGTNYTVEDGVVLYNSFISESPHSGRKCFKIIYGDDPGEKLDLGSVMDDNGKGHIIRFWAKYTPPADSASFVTGDLVIKANGTTLPIKYIGRSGVDRWCLYEAIYPGVSPATSVHYVFYNHTSGSDVPIYIDDILIKPLESKVTCYVYDTRTYKLWAIIDDNHFSTRYQYNGEGKLIRKIKETIHGTRQADEAQYHTPTSRYLKDIGNY